MSSDATTNQNDAAPAQEQSPVQASERPGMKLIKAYLAVYAVLAVAYVAFRVTGGQTLAPEEFWKQAFPGFNPNGSQELSTEDFDEEHGHLLLWDELSFTRGHQTHRIPADARLTDFDAVAIGKTLLVNKPHYVVDEIVVNKYGITKSTWAYILTVYNIGGMFLLIIVFLKQPLLSFLDAKAEEAATDLKHAREAKSEAERLEKRRDEILAEVEAKRKEMEATAEEEFAEERDRIIASAKHEAEGLLETLEDSIQAEIALARKELRQQIASEALRLASEIIEKEASDEDHITALNAFVEDVKKAKVQ